MIAEVTQRLAQKSKQALDLSRFLHAEIAELRKAIIDKRVQETARQLQCENEELRKQVEELKSTLSELEARNKKGHQSSTASMQQLKQETNEPEKFMLDTTVKSAPQKKPQQTTGKSESPKREETKNTEPKQKPQKEKKSAASEDDKQPVDVRRLDFRIGRILNAKKHPDADSLYVEEVELGENKPRTVVSGLVKFVPLDEMQNRLVVLLCNLKPVKMRGITSEAMVMCASTPEKVEILNPPANCVPGERISFEGYSGTPDAQLNPKKKIFEQVAPDLKTNDQCVATYKGVPFTVAGKGVVTAPTLSNVQIK